MNPYRPTSRVLVPMLLALSALASGLHAAEQGAEEVSLAAPGIDDTARILKITNRSGTFKLRSEPKSVEYPSFRR